MFAIKVKANGRISPITCAMFWFQLFFVAVVAMKHPNLLMVGFQPLHVTFFSSPIISHPTYSTGVPFIRDEVCRFVEARDGYSADREAVFLTDGASPAVAHILYSLISAPNIGVRCCHGWWIPSCFCGLLRGGRILWKVELQGIDMLVWCGSRTSMHARKWNSSGEQYQPFLHRIWCVCTMRTPAHMWFFCSVSIGSRE